MKPTRFCCERFKESYDLGEIVYAYEESEEIDETDWFVCGFYHLYYCPFCGAFVKGTGFGNYDLEHPPNEKTKIVVQDNSDQPK